MSGRRCTKSGENPRLSDEPMEGNAAVFRQNARNHAEENPDGIPPKIRGNVEAEERFSFKNPRRRHPSRAYFSPIYEALPRKQPPFLSSKTAAARWNPAPIFGRNQQGRRAILAPFIRKAAREIRE